MKRSKTASIRLPRKGATYDELADFFDRHDGTELLKQGIMEPNTDRKTWTIEHPAPRWGQTVDRKAGPAQHDSGFRFGPNVGH